MAQWCNAEFTDTLNADQMQARWYVTRPPLHIFPSQHQPLHSEESLTDSFACHREDGSPGVGGWLSEWAEYVSESGSPNDRWADNIMTVAAPNVGNNDLGGCGVIGSSCNPEIDCEDWASRGYGGHYWAIQALKGYVDQASKVVDALDDRTKIADGYSY